MQDYTFDSTDEKLLTSMQILGDPTRYMMFRIVSSHPEYCVSELALKLDVTPSAISQHYTLFESAELMTKKRYGQKICYQVAENQLAKAMVELTQS